MSKKNIAIKWRLDDGQIEVVDDKMAEILKLKTSSERLEIVFGMWHSATIQLRFCIKSLHQEWDEDRVREEVARRLSHGAI